MSRREGPAIRARVPAALTRREVIALGGMATATLLLSRCATVPTGRPAGAVVPFSPIDRTLGDFAPRAFSGEDPAPAHDVLWDKDAFLASYSGAGEPPERVPLVVVGGGIAGLTAAWELRRHQPVVLERGPRFGGNSRGEAWRGIDYAIGAAYFIRPDEGSPIADLLEGLGLGAGPRVKDTEDPVVLGGRRIDGFWDGAGGDAGADQARRLAAYFRAVLEGAGGHEFPDIPVTDAAQRGAIDALDRVSFHDHLVAVAGEPLDPGVAAVLEHYCWSSLGASMGEISAAAGLNFYASEFGEVCVLPGGNAAVAERLVERLHARLLEGRLRPSSLVVDVAARDDGVLVTYLDAAGALRRLHAAAAVLACPKFVAARLLRDLEPARRAAIDRLAYRAYLVANVLLDRPLADDFYDLFLAGDGGVDLGDVEAAARRQGVTDVVLGTWARPDRRRSVLTLYAALPWDGARAEVLEDDAYAPVRARFERQISAEILPLVGARDTEVVDLRVARWGHPLPVAATGLIASGVPDALRAPFRSRVFFVQQDNWALPAFETAVTEALLWAGEVDRRVRAG